MCSCVFVKSTEIDCADKGEGGSKMFQYKPYPIEVNNIKKMKDQ